MAVTNKIPQLRFKGFTQEWEEKTFSDCYKMVSGYAFKYSDYVKVGVAIINGESIQHGKLECTNYNYLPPSYREQYSKVLLEEGDIVVGLNRPITNGHLKIARIPKELNKSLLYQRAGKIKHLAKISSSFSFILLGKEILKHTLREAVGSDQPFISTSKLDKWKMLIPKASNEKNKIGNYFQQLDTLITQHQQKHDKLLNIKKALLEKIFPKQGEYVPEIRFKGFSGEWEERELSDEVDFYSGLTYSPANVVKDGGTFVLRSSNVKNGELLDADNVFVDSSVINSINVKVGDIITVVRNGSRSLIGKHAQIKVEMSDTVIGAFMTGIRSNQSNFINALLNTTQFTKEIEKNLGATINQITTGAFKKMRFMFSEPDEQKKIGEMFNQLDTLLTQHQTQLNKLKNIKQACLEKMFV